MLDVLRESGTLSNPSIEDVITQGSDMHASVAIAERRDVPNEKN
jgi:hypothetical protein